MKKKFKPGEAIVYEPSYSPPATHPLSYGQVVHFLAYHSPAIGHCIVTTYQGKVITMLHPEEFRLATEDEV